MSGAKILRGLKEAITGRFARVSRIVVENGETRPMTDAEAAAFDKGFAAMGAAFDEMGRAFGRRMRER